MSEIKQEFIKCLGALQANRQFRYEAFSALMRVNTWRLDQTHFDSQANLIPLYLDTTQSSNFDAKESNSTVLARSLDELCESNLAQDVKHFYMNAELSHYGISELPNGLPIDLDRRDKVAARRWLWSQYATRSNQTWKKRSERELSADYAKDLTSLMSAQRLGLCNPRSLTIDVIIHETHLYGQRLDQCGLTIRIQVKFHISETNTGAQEHRLALQRLPYRTDDLEPKRQFLLPLLAMQNIQSIEVSRTWTLKALKKHKEESLTSDKEVLVIDSVQEIPMFQHFRYKTTQEFLLAAGKDLMNFRGIGLDEAGLRMEQILQVRENTPHVEHATVILQKPISVPDFLLQGFGTEWNTGTA